MGYPRQEHWSELHFFMGSSQPRAWTQVSCVSALANGIFTSEPAGKPIGSLEPMENMSPHWTATQLFKYLKIVLIIITKALIASWVAVLYQICYVCKWMERMSFSWTPQETSNRCVCKGNLIALEMGSQWWDSEISKATLWTEICLLWRVDSLHEWISVSRTPSLIFFKLRIRTGRGWLVLIEEGKGMWRLCPDCRSCSVAQPYLTLRPHGLQYTRLPCPSLSPRLCSNSRPLNRWYHPTISSSVIPFSSCPDLSQHQDLFQWVSSSRQVTKVLEVQLQHQSFQWILKVDFL